MHRAARNQDLVAAGNVDIGQIGGKQGIVFPDRRTQQHWPLVANVESQLREEAGAFEKDAFLSQADRFGFVDCGESMTEKPSTTLPGTVEKIIKSPIPGEPEKAEIAVEGTEDLYKEIRIENTLTDQDGNEVRLKKGAQVEVHVEADPEATVPNTDSPSSEKS